MASIFGMQVSWAVGFGKGRFVFFGSLGKGLGFESGPKGDDGGHVGREAPNSGPSEGKAIVARTAWRERKARRKRSRAQRDRQP